MNNLVNTFPLFHQVEESQVSYDDSLKLIADFFCDNEIQSLFGVALLHKHFDLTENEVLTRFTGEKICLTLPIERDLSPKAKPVAWVADNTESGYSPYEFAQPSDAKNSHCASQYLPNIIKFFRSHNLESVFGIIWLPTYSHLPSSMFEQTDDLARVSFTSRWRDPYHKNSNYSRSTFSFVRRKGVAEIDDKVGCSSCYNCSSTGRKGNVRDLEVKFYINQKPKSFERSQFSISNISKTVALLDRDYN